MNKVTFIIGVFFLSKGLVFSQMIENQNLTGKYLGQKSPGITPEIFAPDILVKNKQAHSNIVFTKDGSEAYWCNNGIWYSKSEKGKWTVPEIVSFSKPEYYDDAPFLSPDDKHLFFTSRRPMYTSDTSRKENIWLVDINESGWSAAHPLPAIINDMFQHWQISVDLTNNLYFRYKLDNNPNSDSDIYCSKFVKGEYQNPEKLDQAINSDANESNPFINPHGDYIIFSRIKDRKPLNGGLFISFRMENGLWTEAVPLSKHMQFNFGGNCPIVSQDGKYLFFLDIFEGKWQRFWVSAEIIEELKP